MSPRPLSQTSARILAEIRSHLAANGHPAHGTTYWRDRGIRITRTDNQNAVVYCTWCYNAAKTPGTTELDAQAGTWRAIGHPADCEHAAMEHFTTVHDGRMDA